MPTQWGRKETVIWPPHSPIYTYGAAFIALVLTGLFLYMRFALGNTPLQRFYTPIYLRASVASEFGAKRQDKYRLLFLTGVEVAPKMPVEADVQDGLTTAHAEKPIPLIPSQTALRSGFDVLFRGPETSFVDAALRDYLKRNVFNGTTLSSIYAEPLFFGILALAVQLPFSIRKVQSC